MTDASPSTQPDAPAAPIAPTAPTAPTDANVTEFRVRYGECDMQGVVFNAHYLAYVDHAIDCWFRAVLAPDLPTGAPGPGSLGGLEPMVRAARLEFHRGLVFGDTASVRCAITRWGRTSFDLHAVGTVGGEPRFEATLTYVNVDLATMTPTPVPEAVRAALESFEL